MKLLRKLAMTILTADLRGIRGSATAALACLWRENRDLLHDGGECFALLLVKG
jgi:hypothetical protein